MRRLIWPSLPVLAIGCGTEYQTFVDVAAAGVANPRPLPSAEHTDRVIQTTLPEVDVLWVVDDSCSMFDDQAALAQHFPVFFDFFDGSGLDYHLGVATTDMISASRKGKLVMAQGYRWIDPLTPQAADVFAAFMPGIDGQYPEQGIDATWHALEIEKNGHNLGFLRERSSLHVVLISDEHDYSDQVDDWITPEELASHLNNLRSDPDQVTYSSISLPNTDYSQMTLMVGGIHHPILQGEWDTVLEQLGLQAAGLRREYYLSQLPVVGSIRVEVLEGKNTYSFTEGEDWAYDPVRNSIRFHSYVPNPMSEVHITYEPLASHHGG